MSPAELHKGNTMINAKIDSKHTDLLKENIPRARAMARKYRRRVQPVLLCVDRKSLLFVINYLVRGTRHYLSAMEQKRLNLLLHVSHMDQEGRS